jgi:hypothetical protein
MDFFVVFSANRDDLSSDDFGDRVSDGGVDEAFGGPAGRLAVLRLRVTLAAAPPAPESVDC